MPYGLADDWYSSVCIDVIRWPAILDLRNCHPKNAKAAITGSPTPKPMPSAIPIVLPSSLGRAVGGTDDDADAVPEGVDVADAGVGWLIVVAPAIALKFEVSLQQAAVLPQQ